MSLEEFGPTRCRVDSPPTEISVAARARVIIAVTAPKDCDTRKGMLPTDIAVVSSCSERLEGVPCGTTAQRPLFRSSVTVLSTPATTPAAADCGWLS